MKKILTRTITGILFVALIVISLTSAYSEAFLCVFSLLLLLGLFEFYSLTLPREKIITRILDLIGGLIMFSSFYYVLSYQSFELRCIAPYLAYLILREILQLYTKEENPLANMAYGLLGHIYVALPLSLLNIIYFNVGASCILALFIFIWLNDTGAFCVGCTLGKHRLFERISPKKSWEGFFGGLFFCIVSSILISIYFSTYFGNYSILTWIGFAVIVSIASTWGDLSESLIKRTLNVKDSGKLLPGHGGILDRIDSLLLAAPSVLLYFLIILNL